MERAWVRAEGGHPRKNCTRTLERMPEHAHTVREIKVKAAEAGKVDVSVKKVRIASSGGDRDKENNELLEGRFKRTAGSSLFTTTCWKVVVFFISLNEVRCFLHLPLLEGLCFLHLPR